MGAQTRVTAAVARAAEENYWLQTPRVEVLPSVGWLPAPVVAAMEQVAVVRAVGAAGRGRAAAAEAAAATAVAATAVAALHRGKVPRMQVLPVAGCLPAAAVARQRAVGAQPLPRAGC